MSATFDHALYAFESYDSGGDGRMCYTPPKTRKDPNDDFCPECGCALVLRNGPYGEFVGCSSFPDCKFTAKRCLNEYRIYMLMRKDPSYTSSTILNLPLLPRVESMRLIETLQELYDGSIYSFDLIKKELF